MTWSAFFSSLPSLILLGPCLQDYDRTRQIYSECINLIPHKKFTFAKIWLLYAQFEVRRLDITTARKILGRAIGICPKDRLFKGYIELEMQLREFDRCRTLYTKFLEYNPANCTAWIKFAEVERLLGEYERCRAIFELAVNQPVLDMPEILWKAYIGKCREAITMQWGYLYFSKRLKDIIFFGSNQTLSSTKKNMNALDCYTSASWNERPMSRCTSVMHNLSCRLEKA
jgi:tetratricopeptide (TPR) repeat protein